MKKKHSWGYYNQLLPIPKKLLRIMKLSIILTCVLSANLMASLYSQQARFSFDIKDQSVRDILKTIEKESRFRFFYNDEFTDLDKKMTLSISDKSIDELMSMVLDKTEVSYRVLENNFIVITPKLLMQQQKITGTVTDATNGEPLPGVNILEKGTNNGTVSDFNGNFSITVLSEQAILQFSFVGYLTEEKPVNGQTKISVTMTEDIMELDEVVVVGYGTIRKSDLTGSLSVVTPKEFTEQNVTRFDQVLQGRAAGVQVTNIEGSPGGDVKIRIRGVNSILGDNNPLVVVDGFVGANLNMLNPNDIESIQVLKDASSTAIFGSRGSNGVIVITTKTGGKGALNVNYQGQASISNVIYKYDLLSAGDFATVVNEKNEALDLNPAFTQQEIDSYYLNRGTDWQDAIYRTAFSHNHQLSISGGDKKTTFLISANYLDQEGIIKNSGFKRYILRSNITTQFNDKLRFHINLAGANMVNLNTYAGYATNNPVVQSLAWAPTTPIYDDKGNYTINDPIGSLKYNPLALIYDRENRVENSFANVISGIQYEFLKGLAFDIQLAIDYSNRQTKVFNGNYVSNFNPNASRSLNQNVTLQSTSTLSYKHSFNELHNINAVAVFESQQYKGEGFNSNATGLKFPDLGYDNLSQASSYSIGSDYTKWTLMSFVGRVNYSFGDKYLFSATIRRDGSSKFQPSNRWSTFPSIAVGWNLANENFMKNLNFISKLKIRASWGLTGSQAIQPYATESTYNTNVVAAFNNSSITSGIQLGNPGNPDLKWETTEQKDIGAEIGLFKGKLTAEVDYFIKNTRDLLLNRPLPAYAGGGNIASNIGEIKNKGWELLIGGTIVNTNRINWTSYFNISKVKNTVVSIGDVAERIFTGTNTSGIASQSEFVYEPGVPLGSYWGLVYLGTWKPDEAEEAALYGSVPGDARYDEDGYQIIGCGLPKTSTGWNNTITYKNITINVFFQGILGVDKLNILRGAALMGDRDNRQATLEEIKDRYIPGVNETSDIPAFSKTSYIHPQSTMFMEDGSFIRLKNLSLAYNIPINAINKIKNIKLFLNATNLLTFTKYQGIDVEASSVSSSSDLTQSIDFGAYPNSKTYSVGLNVSF
jgi:TonB-linked SusC/RagA family outer membrane protein